MTDHAKHRRAARKARENAHTLRASIPAMTARTMLAARQAGSEAVRFSDGLAGTRKLTIVRPYGWHNPLSSHHEDSTATVRQTVTARNPRDHQAEAAAKLHLMTDLLTRLRITK